MQENFGWTTPIFRPQLFVEQKQVHKHHGRRSSTSMPSIDHFNVTENSRTGLEKYS